MFGTMPKMAQISCVCWYLSIQQAFSDLSDSSSSISLTLPETNIAMENPQFWWYLPGKMGNSPCKKLRGLRSNVMIGSGNTKNPRTTDWIVCGFNRSENNFLASKISYGKPCTAGKKSPTTTPTPCDQAIPTTHLVVEWTYSKASSVHEKKKFFQAVHKMLNSPKQTPRPWRMIGRIVLALMGFGLFSERTLAKSGLT